MKLKILIFLLINIFGLTKGLSQKFVFKHECFIGKESNIINYDTLYYQSNLDLEFLKEKFIEFQPSYFQYIRLKKKSKKPIIRKLFKGYLTEYYDELNRLIKYTFYESHGQTFDVVIKYNLTGKPYKIIEYFEEEHHSENGIFSVQYDFIYNEKNELTQIESRDGNNYICKITRM